VGSAGGWLLGLGSTAALAGPLGGAAPSVALLAVVALPLATLALALVPETAGRALAESQAPAPHPA
jgi:hypothetical protein